MFLLFTPTFAYVKHNKNEKNMKNVMQWFLTAVCLFTIGNAQVMAEDNNKNDSPSVPVPIIIGKSFDGSDARGNIGIPFIAYYQAGTIYVSTSADFSSIAINVENETTNQAWNTTTDISDGMGEISISAGGTGSYSVEIVTEYGECFLGSFTL